MVEDAPKMEKSGGRMSEVVFEENCRKKE